MKVMVVGLLTLASVLTAVMGFAGENPSIGKVKKTAGQVFIERGEQSVPVVPGTVLFRGDVLATGPDGTVGIIFNDNAVMSMGENSRLALTEYVFDPALSHLGFWVDIFKGTVTYLTGIIGKINPDRVKFKTPTAIVGIRGTHLAIKVEE